MKNRTRRSLLATSSIMLAAGSFTAPLTGWSALEEIIVTARKREETLQSVPIAIQAFTGDQIQRFGITDISDVAQFTPSVQFDSNFGPLDNRITIRGLSQTRGRPSAAILVDGIDVTSESVSFSGTGSLLTQRLLDVERIEVVKGPQSALYGRSAFNGAVQYITRNPSLEALEGHASVDIAEFGRRELKGSISGPLITDTLALGFNATVWNEDGFYRHPATLERVGGGDGWGLAATVLFEPSERLRLRGRMEYSDDTFDSQAQTTIRHNQQLLLTDPENGVLAGCTEGVFAASACNGRLHPILRGNMGNADGRSVSTSLNPRTGKAYPGSERSFFRASLQAEWSEDWGTITSWTGFTDGESSFFIDGDFDAVLVGPIGNQTDESGRAQEFEFDDDIRQLSQELRYTTKLDGPLQVTVGGLYWYEKIQQEDNSRISDVFAAFIPDPIGPAAEAFPFFQEQPTFFTRNTDHWSLYAALDWEVTERWKVTVEGRYVDEKTEVTGPVALPVGACFDSFGFACSAPSFPDVGDLLAFFQGNPLPEGVIRRNSQGYLTDSASSSYFTPKITVEFSASDDLLAYGYIARAIKPGGLSAVTSGAYFDPDGDGTANEYRYDEEKLLVVEGGLKSTWLDGRLQANLAAFHQRYTDKQVSTRGIACEDCEFETGLVSNAGRAEIIGVELDVIWRPLDELTLMAAYTYLDSEYKSFSVRSTSPMAALRAGNCTVQEAPITGTPECLLDLSGNKIERTPDHALSLSGIYQRGLGLYGLDWFVEGNGNYQGKRYIDESNTKQLDDYWIANFSVGLIGENWTAAVYVRNAFDDNTIRSGVDAGGFVDATLIPGTFGSTFSPADNLVSILPDPRYWGIRASYRF